MDIYEQQTIWENSGMLPLTDILNAEDEFNYLAKQAVRKGRITQDEAEEAMGDFHIYINRNRFVPDGNT